MHKDIEIVQRISKYFKIVYIHTGSNKLSESLYMFYVIVPTGYTNIKDIDNISVTFFSECDATISN